ncbi:dynein gamma chain protein [Arabiibacter massiliensis]|uniref:dynein gamma chain protein n=1 Tax=Arabiibacter massiliensis TaxID=1870985 RepID=UPI0009BA22F9|nr:dynein gamma chain protein [Arabiibacter massiliensis]
MCTNGMNVDQFGQMIDMIDDYTALGYRWAHKLAHVAGDAGNTSASEKLHAVQMLLADARALLDEAKTCAEEGATVASGATVKLV